MKQIMRLYDIGSGHDCYPPRKIITANPLIRINGKPVARIGDIYEIHVCKDNSDLKHSGYQACGNYLDRFGNIPVARKGDCISCGGYALTSSPNIYG